MFIENAKQDFPPIDLNKYEFTGFPFPSLYLFFYRKTYHISPVAVHLIFLPRAGKSGVVAPSKIIDPHLLLGDPGVITVTISWESNQLREMFNNQHYSSSHNITMSTAHIQSHFILLKVAGSNHLVTRSSH